jgi:hypothetical protein
MAFDGRAATVTRERGDVLTTHPTPGYLLEMGDPAGLLPQLQRRFQARTTP